MAQTIVFLIYHNPFASKLINLYYLIFAPYHQISFVFSNLSNSDPATSSNSNQSPSVRPCLLQTWAENHFFEEKEKSSQSLTFLEIWKKYFLKDLKDFLKTHLDAFSKFQKTI